MASFKSYEERIHPTDEQKIKITEILDEQDRVFNESVDFANILFLFGAKTDEIVDEISSGLTDAPYNKNMLKEIRALTMKLERGEIDTIKPRFPHRCRRSFEFSPVEFDKQSVLLPNIGWVRVEFHRSFPSNSHIFSAVVTEDQFKSCYKIIFRLLYNSDVAITHEMNFDNVIGLDYKQDGLYVDSNGHSGDYPAFWLNGRKKVAELYKTADRFSVGSNRWLKFQKRAAKLSAHISNQRKDWQYKKAAELARENDAVCIESIAPAEMIKNDPSLAPKLRDNDWVSFRKKLEDQLSARGKPLVMVDKYYPSSQICSVCGYQFGKQPTNVRTIVCPNCDTILDRDINAARNIRDEGLRLLQAS